MINDTQVSNLGGSAKTQSPVASRATISHVFGRAIIATALMVTAVAALAVTSLVQSHDRATAQGDNSIQAVQSPPVEPTSVSLDSGEVRPFAFGYLVFENDPAGGVHGFGPLPPRAPAQ